MCQTRVIYHQTRKFFKIKPCHIIFNVLLFYVSVVFSLSRFLKKNIVISKSKSIWFLFGIDSRKNEEWENKAVYFVNGAVFLRMQLTLSINSRLKMCTPRFLGF